MQEIASTNPPMLNIIERWYYEDQKYTLLMQWWVYPWEQANWKDLLDQDRMWPNIAIQRLSSMSCHWTTIPWPEMSGLRKVLQQAGHPGRGGGHYTSTKPQAGRAHRFTSQIEGRGTVQAKDNYRMLKILKPIVGFFERCLVRSTGKDIERSQ